MILSVQVVGEDWTKTGTRGWVTPSYNSIYPSPVSRLDPVHSEVRGTVQTRTDWSGSYPCRSVRLPQTEGTNYNDPRVARRGPSPPTLSISWTLWFLWRYWGHGSSGDLTDSRSSMFLSTPARPLSRRVGPNDPH